MIFDFNLFNAFIAHLMLSLCFISFHYAYSFHYALHAFTMFYKLSLYFTSFHYTLQAFTMFITFNMLYNLSLCL
jgi:hypothetical protein